MTSSEHSDVSDPNQTNRRVSSPISVKNMVSLTVFGCSIAALVISFLGLQRFDLPVTKYVRSVTVHLPWDQLTIPWMAFTSNAGDWIGQGWRLASVSLLLLAAAWAFNRPMLKLAAIQSLIAHGIAAVLANVLKHLIGRPRPKFLHSGDWQMAISWISGLDSFPSGHSTASFAVATVLAKRFPTWGPLCMGFAAFVALSRVLRGSHFPTDVVGGAVVGILSGSIAAAPLKEWRTSVQQGCRDAAIWASLVLAVLWTLSHKMDDSVTGMLFMAVGVSAVMAGFWIRRTYWLSQDRPRETWSSKTSLYLIAYGLAAMTTSPLVHVAVGFTCMASWFDRLGHEQIIVDEWSSVSVMKEGVLLGSVALAVLILVGARGVLPFQ
ncbi:MAG: phosphatase PAP2 family protein [Nitrospira sp.]|nr:phosphatase PAP2 family protein [Nitrospira sp.]